jgi:hypothetical protein
MGANTAQYFSHSYPYDRCWRIRISNFPQHVLAMLQSNNLIPEYQLMLHIAWPTRCLIKVLPLTTAYQVGEMAKRAN